MVFDDVKQQYYKKDAIVRTKNGIIDFRKSEIAKTENGTNLSYDKWLNIQLTSLLLNNFRHDLALCYYENNLAEFQGIISIKWDKPCMIKIDNLKINSKTQSDILFTGDEDHIWLKTSTQLFKDISKRFNKGDEISFTGEVYRYIKQRNIMNFTIRNPENIKPIHRAVNPLFIDSCPCDHCLFIKYCNGNCSAFTDMFI